ncbi:hypothetical protein C6P46_006196 [Rhodotorula mucilaginosa]|uniref:Cystathionine beta-synthase n=1 Tax=Rhodotorula mucilaginosa TaxID=5537 RepID=A0A9P7B3V5_RHOMI|nr:hypothetical protein C6P46_006196 [Rhodotorula mucilaginosa]TKA50938.1 hypothetical protein B0A53_05719 [Rhodotorula sp. CCFEE 5036]
MVDYRGANIDDLQLSPALVLPVSTSVGTALQLAFERDFSILPLHSTTSRAELLGWLSIDALKPLAEQGQVDLDAPLSALLRGDAPATTNGQQLAASQSRAAAGEERPVKEFKRGRKYEVITPETPLEKLEAFFAEQQAPGGSKVQFALVTDAARKFVLGVVTVDDLNKFTQRRFPNATAAAASSIPA